MSLVVKQELELLLSLQEIEDKKSSLQKSIDRVAEEQKELDLLLEKKGLKLKKKEEDFLDLKKQYKNFEDELAYNEECLSRGEKNLRLVSNQKEYQLLLREIDDNKKLNSKLQETMLSLLDQLSELEADFKKEELSFLSDEKYMQEKKEELLLSCSQEIKALEDIELERKKLEKDLSPRLLKLFASVLKLGNGMGLARVSKGICRGCFMSLPPQFCIEIQRAETIRHCPRCNRIVYWDGA